MPEIGIFATPDPCPASAQKLGAGVANRHAQSHVAPRSAGSGPDSSFEQLHDYELWWMPGEVTGQGRDSRRQEVWSRGFTHLHVASGYSARYGASLPHTLVQRAVERGMTTLALTDRDGGAAAADHPARAERCRLGAAVPPCLSPHRAPNWCWRF
jgi:hypothetical protein